MPYPKARHGCSPRQSRTDLLTMARRDHSTITQKGESDRQKRLPEGLGGWESSSKKTKEISIGDRFQCSFFRGWCGARLVLQGRYVYRLNAHGYARTLSYSEVVFFTAKQSVGFPMRKVAFPSFIYDKNNHGFGNHRTDRGTAITTGSAPVCHIDIAQGHRTSLLGICHCEGAARATRE